ncbi:hypothetical protein [Oryzibacter oryziterrae]|uniref:hypothetical protein n=1 Tax=Oryzibacter oryziterrae TaxID=2766474 RepID=UPI001F48D173|nr:hypothetical protein [Oryzibacter oryziterrae]
MPSQDHLRNRHIPGGATGQGTGANAQNPQRAQRTTQPSRASAHTDLGSFEASFNNMQELSVPLVEKVAEKKKAEAE